MYPTANGWCATTASSPPRFVSLSSYSSIICEDHIQGSGRARALASQIYYFANDPKEEVPGLMAFEHGAEVSKQTMLREVARDERLNFSEEERRRSESVRVG